MLTHVSRQFQGLVFWVILFSFCFLTNAVGGHWFVKHDAVDFDVESTRIAAALIHGKGFQDPFGPMPTGPSAHIAPLYPAFYAAVMMVFGMGNAGWWVIRLFTIAAYATQLVLLPALADRLAVPRRSGLIAAVFGALLPIPGSSYKWESIFAGLLLAATAYFVARIHQEPSNSRNVIGASLFAGMGFLASPVLTSVWLGWLCVLAIFTRRSISRRTLAVLMIVPFAVILPWVVRNYSVFGAFIYIRDNLGIELAKSNNDCATAWSKDNLTHPECFAKEHPNANPDLDRRILNIGEYRFNTERFQMAMAWISAHPQRFAALSAERFSLFWLPGFAHENGIAKLAAILVSVLTVLSAAGLLLLRRFQSFAFWFVLTCLALYPAVYYLVQGEIRYRYPILWVTFLAAGFAVDRWLWMVGGLPAINPRERENSVFSRRAARVESPGWPPICFKQVSSPRLMGLRSEADPMGATVVSWLTLVESLRVRVSASILSAGQCLFIPKASRTGR